MNLASLGYLLHPLMTADQITDDSSDGFGSLSRHHRNRSKSASFSYLFQCFGFE